jgi:hypothetical protein
MLSDTANNDTLIQISFVVNNAGKKRPTSKKRITWTFGQGAEQHTVSFTWSKRSGKQRVDMDGTEVWFGRKKSASVFFHKWTTREGMHLHILATTKTPKKNVSPEFRKYDLMINSQVFANLPFQDGSKPPERQGDSRMPASIVDIIYPTGYTSDDLRFPGHPPENHTPTSTVEEYQDHAPLRQKVVVYQGGTPP